MALSVRSWLIWAALAGTLIAARFAPDEPAAAAIAAPVTKGAVIATDGRDGANTTASRNGTHTPTESSTATDGGTTAWKGTSTVTDADEVLELKPRDDETRPGATFASMTWASPHPLRTLSAQPAVPEPLPAPPAAPPLPFRVLGRFEEQGKLSVFMQYNEQTVVASAGVVINNLYKVEQVSESSVTLIYLPLGERQELNVASAN